jgi:hypothetical protein
MMGSMLDELVAPITGASSMSRAPALRKKWTAQWISTAKPRRAAGRVEYAERSWYVAESLYAPLAQDGETPDILMVVAFYHATDKGEGASRDIAARLTAEVEARAAAVVS